MTQLSIYGAIGGLMADEQMADESGWRAADHNARIVADGLTTLLEVYAEEIEQLRAALREIRALHQPEWASEQARAAGKEPWVCALCGTADGGWPCDTVATVREVLGDE